MNRSCTLTAFSFALRTRYSFTILFFLSGSSSTSRIDPNFLFNVCFIAFLATFIRLSSEHPEDEQEEDRSAVSSYRDLRVATFEGSNVVYSSYMRCLSPINGEARPLLDVTFEKFVLTFSEDSSILNSYLSMSF